MKFDGNIFKLLLVIPALVAGFQCPATGVSKEARTVSTTQLYDGVNTGGWGNMAPRDIRPEEYAKKDRSYYEPYRPKSANDFSRLVDDELKSMKAEEDEEIWNLARFAGLDVEKLKKGAEDDEYLDVSI